MSAAFPGNRGLLGAWIAAGVACQAPSPSVAPKPRPSETSTQEAARTAPGSVSRPAPVPDGAIDDALARVAARRRLTPKTAVRTRWVERRQLVQHARSKLEGREPRRVLRGYETLLFGLGLVPHDFSFEQAMTTLLGQTLAGLYDPDSDTLLLAIDLDPSEVERTISHELVHALQDQHFGLDGRLRLGLDRTDQQSALQTFAEGDATCAAGDTSCDEPPPIAALACDRPTAGAAGSRHVPCVIVHSLMAPYVDGVRVVRSLVRRGGWAAVDAVWADLPSTTHQLLHLDERFRHPVRPLPLPPRPDSAFVDPTYQDVLGEQTLRIVLQQWVRPKEAAEIASGWAGDRVAVFRMGDRSAVAWHLRFDSALRASRAEVGLRSGLLAQDSSGGPTGHGESGRTPDMSESRRPVRCRTTDRGPVVVEAHGCDIAVTIGPFRHSRPGEPTDATCTAAVAWARKVAGQQ